MYKLVAIYYWSCIALVPSIRWSLGVRCLRESGVWADPGFRDTRPRHSRVTRHSSRHYTRPPSPHTLALVTTEQMLLTSPHVHAKIPRCLGVFIKRLIWSHSLPQIRQRPRAPRTSRSPHRLFTSAQSPRHQLWIVNTSRDLNCAQLYLVFRYSEILLCSIFCFCGSAPIRSITSVAMAGWCPAAGAVPQSDQIRWVEIIHWLEYCESSTGQELSTSTRCDKGTWFWAEAVFSCGQKSRTRLICGFLNC